MEVNLVSFRRVTAYLAVVAALAIAAAAQTAPPPAASSGGLDEAKRLIGDGKRTEAIAVLEGIASSDQAFAPQALKMMGDCYKIQKKWSQAIKCFEKLLAGYPNSVAPDREVRSWMMDCYLANSQPDKALALRKELLSQYQSDAWRLYYIIGRRYVWRHESSKAIPELTKAIELGIASKNDPGMIDANWFLVHCCVVEKQFAKAEALAQQLIRDHPEVAYRFYGELGRCYQGRGVYDKAIESLETAVKLSPKGAGNLKGDLKSLLRCYEGAGRRDEVTSLARKLVKEFPEEPAWRWESGRQYFGTGEYDKAAPLFKEVIASSKEQWEIRSSQIYLGECLFAVGKGNEALEGIERYYKDKPDLWDEHLLVKSAVLFHGAKDNEGCLAGVRQLLAEVTGGKKSPLVATARELMYRALEEMGKRAEAASVLEAMGADSKDPIWLSRAGQDYYKAGKYTDAKRVYKAVAERAGVPDDVRAECMYGLALCYWETGLKEAARRLMVRVSEAYPDDENARRARGSLYLWSEER